MKLILNILVWNDRRYLPELIGSIKQQTHADYQVRILDNGSTDGSTEYLTEHVPQWLYGKNPRNVGFAPGHNQLLAALYDWPAARLADTLIVIANADMIFTPDLFAKLIQAATDYPLVGVFQPKLYKAVASSPDEPERSVKTDRLDTTGLAWPRNWRLVDRGEGEVDRGQFDGAVDLIGPAGAMFTLRGNLLPEVSEGRELFDGDFFAYREDCDFALRLQRLGHKTRFIPTAIAYHYRGMPGGGQRGWRKIIADRRSRRPFLAALSTRNQLLFLIKNLSLTDLLRFGPRIMIAEFPRIFFGLIFEPETRRRLLSLLPLVRRAWHKKKKLWPRAKLTAASLRAYIQ